MADQEKTEHQHYHHHIPEEARQHARNAREEMRKSWEALMPPAFVSHRRHARREMLLAARALINHALARLESYETKAE
jgi:uncharacterized SAM-binding protein YcdF (DUF218 family)